MVSGGSVGVINRTSRPRDGARQAAATAWVDLGAGVDGSASAGVDVGTGARVDAGAGADVVGAGVAGWVVAGPADALTVAVAEGKPTLPVDDLLLDPQAAMVASSALATIPLLIHMAVP